MAPQGAGKKGCDWLERAIVGGAGGHERAAVPAPATSGGVGKTGDRPPRREDGEHSHGFESPRASVRRRDRETAGEGTVGG